MTERIWHEESLFNTIKTSDYSKQPCKKCKGSVTFCRQRLMMGVIIPMVMVKLGRDPAVGSSVMITAITDTGGFFIFLGLATLFLM